MSFRAACLVGTLAVLATSLAGLASFELMDVDEPRFATASRRLWNGGDWIVPWFNGAERLDKPILIYWLQAACMQCFGPSELAARLPSALAITGTVPLIASLGRTLGLWPVTAVLAGVAVATCGAAQMLAHAATADAVLLFLTAWIAKLQIDGFAGRDGVRTTVGLGLLFGLAFLTKGPPALVAPASLGLGLIAAGHRTRVGRLLVGTAIAVAVVAAWAIPALERTEGRFWTIGVLHHVVARSLEPFEGHGGHAPFWYLFYVVAIPAAFLPWSPFLLALRHGAWLDAQALPGTKRILCWWFFGTAAVFTLATSKLAHYPLPAFPALAIAVMFAVQNVSGRGDRIATATDRRLGALLVACAALAAGALVAIFPGFGMPLTVSVLLTAAAFAVGFGNAGQLAWRGRTLSAAIATAATMIAGIGMLASMAMPAFAQHGAARAVNDRRAELFPPGVRVFTYALSMPSLVFYLDRDVAAIAAEAGGRSAAELAVERALEPGCVVVTTQNKLQELLDATSALHAERAALARERLQQPRAVLRGFLPNKGKVVDLVVLGS